MSTCVVFYSWGGNNEALATFLSKRLECSVVRIVESKLRAGWTIFFDLLFGRVPALERLDEPFEAHEHVILCGPVWAGRLAAPLRAFLRAHGPQLRDYSFISLCGHDRPEQRAALEDELARRVGHAPRALCQLPVSDLLPPEQRHRLRSVNAHRVQVSELSHYGAELDEFLRGAGLSGAPLASVAPPFGGRRNAQHR
ncbi:MAG: hypothetical protein RL033_93 [Pseudomonadota bacterium]